MEIRTVLGIETSCDETAAAVVRDGSDILSNIISSQIDLHAEYGGVVPELASRRHLERVTPVIDQALSRAGVSLTEIDGIAVTRGPGLPGALLVGVSAAKGLALGRGLPLTGVNHIAGHIYAAILEHGLPDWPVLALVVSGGHTELVLVGGLDCAQILGRTRDDAAGEAFDKTARALGLGFPGGPAIDALAADGDPEAIAFPRAYLEPDSLDFSFSGLKTAVLVYLDRKARAGEPVNTADVAASFQQAVVDVLVDKAVTAVRRTGANAILMAGGVAANRGLRRALAERGHKEEIPIIRPSPVLCTDNAAMIACAGYHRFRLGRFDGLDLSTNPGLELDMV